MEKLILAMLLVVFPIIMYGLGAQAQQCSTHALGGTYVVTCDGFLPAPNGTLLPAKLLGMGAGDRLGNFSFTSTMMVGGQRLAQEMWTAQPLQINADCTGSAIYNEKINGEDGLQLTFDLIATRDGKQVDVIETTPGSVFSCKVTRVAEK